MNKPLKIGVVGIPGKWSTEALADAVEAKTGFRLVIDMAKVKLDLTNMSVMFDEYDLCQLDGLMVKKISAEYSPDTIDRLEILRVAEAQGVRVFSPAESMLRLIDRLSCTVTMRNADVPMPDTCVTENIDEAMAAVKSYGEAVFKPLFSTKARGMCVLSAKSDDASLRADIEQFQQHNPVMYLQKKLDLPGKDLGMVFLGGEYICTYARVAQNSETWNTTINSGGRYEAFEPSDDIIAIAKHAQSLFNMDFTTVDVALTDTGPIVFEVSAFGGFNGVKEGCGMDAAAMYVDYAMKALNA